MPPSSQCFFAEIPVAAHVRVTSRLRLKDSPELLFMGLARGQRVHFPFAVEEHGVFPYNSRELLV